MQKRKEGMQAKKGLQRADRNASGEQTPSRPAPPQRSPFSSCFPTFPSPHLTSKGMLDFHSMLPWSVLKKPQYVHRFLAHLGLKLASASSLLQDKGRFNSAGQRMEPWPRRREKRREEEELTCADHQLLLSSCRARRGRGA